MTETRHAEWKCEICGATGDLRDVAIENAWTHAANEHEKQDPGCAYSWDSEHIVFTQDSPYPD